MREIRFRMWSTNATKYFYDATNVLECLIQQSTGMFDHISDGMFFEQYTGLKDKSGSDIYEGDVVKGRCNSDMGEINTIVWGDSSFCIYGKVKDGYNLGFALCQSEASVLEIIGNIHEANKTTIGE